MKKKKKKILHRVKINQNRLQTFARGCYLVYMDGFSRAGYDKRWRGSLELISTN